MEPILKDRRQTRRYPIEMELRYKLLKGKHVLLTGTGKTQDLSSGGISFRMEERAPSRTFIELSIAWPRVLENGCPLKLIIFGRVVRSDRETTAIAVIRHEFRTCGSRSQQAAQENGMSVNGYDRAQTNIARM